MGVFGWQHMTYLVLTLVLTIVALVLVKVFCKNPSSVKIIYWVSSGLVLVFILVTRLSTSIILSDYKNLIPSSFCIIACSIMAVGVIFLTNKNHAVFHCVVYIAVLGSVLTIFQPGFFRSYNPNYSSTIFEVRAITGLLYHSFALFLGLLLIVTGDMQPDWRRLWILVLGYGMFIMWAVMCIQMFGIPNAMEIERPILDGTVLYWWVIGLSYFGFLFVVLGGFSLVKWLLTRRKLGRSLCNVS